MRRHIAFLHTSPAHVATFDRLLKAADPSLRVDHFVAEDLLAEAQRVGADQPALIARVHAAMAAAAANGAAIVVCTCSTIGGAAERTPTAGAFRVARIDRAMADRAVALGPRIRIVAALESTLEPTAELIRESARAAGADVALERLFVEDAWPHFRAGDSGAYIESLVAAVRAAPAAVDVVVLAQASMAPAATALRELGIQALSSPELGVTSAIASLENDE